MSISVESLTKVYGQQKAIDGISFNAAPGVLGFLGPNGAGKSTTMKILTGYLPQTSGKASVCGFDVETQALEVKRNIGYLPESNPLYQDMYVKESLHFIANIHKIDQAEKRINDIIEQTGLTPERHKTIGQLSKGYRQRVGLAQAILHDPQVLILDEPTRGIDVGAKAEIYDLMRSLAKDGVALLMISSDMEEVLNLSDRIAVMHEGRISGFLDRADASEEAVMKLAVGGQVKGPSGNS